MLARKLWVANPASYCRNNVALLLESKQIPLLLSTVSEALFSASTVTYESSDNEDETTRDFAVAGYQENKDNDQLNNIEWTPTQSLDTPFCR